MFYLNIYFTSLANTYGSGGYWSMNVKHGLYVENYETNKCKAMDTRWQRNNNDEDKLAGQKEKGTTSSAGDRRRKECRCVYNKKKSETLWDASTEIQRIFIVDISEEKVDGRRSSYNYLVRWVHPTTGFTCYRHLNNPRRYSWQRNLAATGKA